MRRRTIVASGFLGLGLAGVVAAPVAAQTRVAVPIVIHVPRAGVPRTTAPSVSVTTQTTSPHPGVTTTRITVQDTTGRLLGVSPRSDTAGTSSGTTTTRITVQDTTGRLLGVSPRSRMAATPTESMAAPSGATATRITIQDTTGRVLGASPASGMLAPTPSSTSSVRIGVNRGSLRPAGAEDLPGAVGNPGLHTPFALEAGSGARRTVTITSDAPIDTPIVIVGP